MLPALRCGCQPTRWLACVTSMKSRFACASCRPAQGYAAPVVMGLLGSMFLALFMGFNNAV